MGGGTTHEQVLHQRLHILGGFRGGGVVGRQLDERGQEVLAFLHVFLHFLRRRTLRTKLKPATAQSRSHTSVNQQPLTCDTTVTLEGGVVVGAGAVLVMAVDRTPAGLAAGVPPAVITVWAF